MAGADATGAFVASVFRSQIRSTMTMGLPTDPTLQPTFQWVVEGTYANADQAGHPYDWTEAPNVGTGVAIADLQVPCAVQIGGGSDVDTDAGVENELSAQITLLDQDQATLITHAGRMPDQVVIAGSTYLVDYYTQLALFDVDVFTIFVTARDQK